MDQPPEACLEIRLGSRRASDACSGRKGEKVCILSPGAAPSAPVETQSGGSGTQKECVPCLGGAGRRRPRWTQRGRKQKRTSGFGRMRPAVTYLTYPLQGGITVTDSQGFSPYSVCRASRGLSWHYMLVFLYLRLKYHTFSSMSRGLVEYSGKSISSRINVSSTSSTNLPFSPGNPSFYYGVFIFHNPVRCFY